MRDFFINSFEKLVNVVVILLAIGVVLFAGMAAFSGGMRPGGMSAGGMGPGGAGGPLVGLGILIGGSIYVIFVGGLLYMGLGIYQNTKRTADAMEKLALK